MDDTTETPEPFSGIAEADPTYWATPAMREPVIRALTADGFPVKPPASWFENPKLKQVTALQVTPEGQVFGHIAAWHQSHIGLAGSVKPPKSKSGYAFFATGALQTADGQMVDVGQISLVGGHAPIDVDVPRAVAHYDDTRSAVCDVAIGEDRHGIWVAGALRPEVNDQQVRQLRASAVSGDWRPINGNLELVAVCSVNVPGFPIPRARVASGATLALVAAGIEPIVEARLLEAGGIAQDSEITVVIDALSDRLSMVERSLTASIKDATKQEKLEELRERVRQTRAMTASVDDLRGRVHGRTAGACKPRKKKPMVADAESDDPAAALRARIHGNVTAALVPGMSGKFDPLKHPRGKDGKFIEVGGFVKWMVGSKEHRGKVTAINKDGSISIDENGKTAKVKPNRISEAADTKASIKKGKPDPAVAKAMDKANAVNGHEGPEQVPDYEPVPAGPVPFTPESFPPGTPVRWTSGNGTNFGKVAEFRPASDSYPAQLKVDLPTGDHAWVDDTMEARIIDPSDKRGLDAASDPTVNQITRAAEAKKFRDQKNQYLDSIDPTVNPQPPNPADQKRKADVQKESLAGVDSNPAIADKAGAKKRLSSNIDRLENGPDKAPGPDEAGFSNTPKPTDFAAEREAGDRLRKAHAAGFSKQDEINAIWAKEKTDSFGKTLDPADQDKLIQLLEEKQKETGSLKASDTTDLKNLKKWQAERSASPTGLDVSKARADAAKGDGWDESKQAEMNAIWAKEKGDFFGKHLAPEDQDRLIQLLEEKKAAGKFGGMSDENDLKSLKKWQAERQSGGGSPAPTEPGPGDGMATGGFDATDTHPSADMIAGDIANDVADGSLDADQLRSRLDGLTPEEQTALYTPLSDELDRRVEDGTLSMEESADALEMFDNVLLGNNVELGDESGRLPDNSKVVPGGLRNFDKGPFFVAPVTDPYTGENSGFAVHGADGSIVWRAKSQEEAQKTAAYMEDVAKSGHAAFHGTPAPPGTLPAKGSRIKTKNGTTGVIIGKAGNLGLTGESGWRIRNDVTGDIDYVPGSKVDQVLETHVEQPLIRILDGVESTDAKMSGGPFDVSPATPAEIRLYPWLKGQYVIRTAGDPMETGSLPGQIVSYQSNENKANGQIKRWATAAAKKAKKPGPMTSAAELRGRVHRAR